MTPDAPLEPRAPAKDPRIGVALLLVLGGLLLVLAVQVWTPGERWLRVGAVVVALLSPLGFLYVGLKARARSRE